MDRNYQLSPAVSSGLAFDKERRLVLSEIERERSIVIIRTRFLRVVPDPSLESILARRGIVHAPSTSPRTGLGCERSEEWILHSRVGARVVAEREK